MDEIKKELEGEANENPQCEVGICDGSCIVVEHYFDKKVTRECPCVHLKIEGFY